jgi:hypothetical protein
MVEDDFEEKLSCLVYVVINMGMFRDMKKMADTVNSIGRAAEQAQKSKKKNKNSNNGGQKYKCKDFGGTTKKGSGCTRKAGWGRSGVKYGCCKHHKDQEDEEKMKEIKTKIRKQKKKRKKL